MPEIEDIEDKLIEAVDSLGLFKAVKSVGREGLPKGKVYPSAFIYFAGDKDTGAKPRPVTDTIFEIITQSKNLGSEKKAARDAYSLLKAVRDAIRGKTLGLTGITPFACSSRTIVGYSGGVISYALRFETQVHGDVPVE